MTAVTAISGISDTESIQKATGKDDVSLTDRMSGGVGGVLGGVVGLADVATSLVGIETNFGETVKQFTTGGLSKVLDDTGIAKVVNNGIADAMDSVMSVVTDKDLGKNIIGWGNKTITNVSSSVSEGLNTLSMMIGDGVNGLKSVLPSSTIISTGLSSLGGMVSSGVDGIASSVTSMLPKDSIGSIASGISSLWNSSKETVSNIVKSSSNSLSSILPVAGIASLLPSDPIGSIASGVSGITSLLPKDLVSTISSLASSTVSNVSNLLPSSKDVSSSLTSLWNFGKESISNITKNPIESLTNILPLSGLASIGSLLSEFTSNTLSSFNNPESSIFNVLGNNSQSVLNSTKEEMNKINSTISEPAKQFEKQKSELLENKINNQQPVIIPIPPPSVIVNSPKDNSISIIQPSSPDPTSIRDIMMGLQLSFT